MGYSALVAQKVGFELFQIIRLKKFKKTKLKDNDVLMMQTVEILYKNLSGKIGDPICVKKNQKLGFVGS